MNGEPEKKKWIKLQYEQNMQFRAKYSNNGTFIAHLIYIKVQKRVMLLCIWLINFEGLLVLIMIQINLCRKMLQFVGCETITKTNSLLKLNYEKKKNTFM